MVSKFPTQLPTINVDGHFAPHRGYGPRNPFLTDREHWKNFSAKCEPHPVNSKLRRAQNNFKYLKLLRDFLTSKTGKTIDEKIANLNLAKLYIDKMLEKLEEKRARW